MPICRRPPVSIRRKTRQFRTRTPSPISPTLSRPQSGFQSLADPRTDEPHSEPAFETIETKMPCTEIVWKSKKINLGSV